MLPPTQIFGLAALLEKELLLVVLNLSFTRFVLQVLINGLSGFSGDWRCQKFTAKLYIFSEPCRRLVTYILLWFNHPRTI